VKIGYLGPKGTFSQEALRKYSKKTGIVEECDFSNVQEIFIALRENRIDEAIVPIENSLEGGVNETLDLIIAEKELFIKAEVIIKVNQNLLAKKGSKLENICVISSHPQPVGQCRNYINSKFPRAVVKYCYSTAEAAKEVAICNGEIAAIGSIIAAEQYQLDVLEKNIQDGENNFTRFVVMSKMDSPPTARDKTSLVFSTQDKPGSLYRVLDIFNLWDVNLSRIESRPSKNKLGEYIFYIDISGHREDEDVKSALSMVKRKSSYLQILGSYPIEDSN